ncbi:MAG: acetate--CoA ligase family protein [Candidatus Aenigmatarchaeota archaeon]
MRQDLELKRRKESSAEGSEKLGKLFDPDGVAVVGVSLQSGDKLGNRILNNVVESGYSGKIYPVNPKAGEDTYLQNMEVYSCLSEIEGNVDVAVISVPRKAVPSVIDECGSKGVDFAVIIASGFEESDKEGRKLSDKVMERAEENDVGIVGPNVLGYVDTSTPINASFSPEFPKEGDVAFLSQSGALGSGMIEKSKSLNLGISKFVSLGNKAMLDETDFLNYLKEDEKTKYGMMYLESISRGEEFVRAGRKLCMEKPVVAIKSGRTESGKIAASSHTGSLGGEDDVTDAALHKAGIIRVEDMEEMVDTVRLIRDQPLPEGRNVLVVTNAGGKGVMAADSCASSAMELASLSQETKEKLKEELPGGVSVKNPVDVMGDADAERYGEVIENGIKDDNVDALLVLMTRQAGTDPWAIKDKICELEEKSDKPILASFFGDGRTEKVASELEEEGIPHFFSLPSAVLSLEKTAWYREWKRRRENTCEVNIHENGTRLKVRELADNGRREVGGEEALELISSCGINTVKNEVVSSPSEARSVAEEIGSKMVMKLESSDLSHKSDIGGVRTEVVPERAEDVFQELVDIAEKNELEQRKVSMQPMVDTEREIIVGGFEHGNFGPVVRFGLGGKYTEVFEDFSSRLTPVSKQEARRMIEETEYASEILEGERDKEEVEPVDITEVIVRISELLTRFEEINEVEINPLLFDGDKPVAVDARISLSGTE